MVLWETQTRRTAFEQTRLPSDTMLFRCLLLMTLLITVTEAIHRIKGIKNRDIQPRAKRQLYLCGIQPYQYYSTSRESQFNFFFNANMVLYILLSFYATPMSISSIFLFHPDPFPACPTSQSCPNGGITLNVACEASYQCTPYYSGVSSCINGLCCTSPNALNNPTTTRAPIVPRGFGKPHLRHESKSFPGVCPSGQLSEVRCTSRTQCASGQTCIGGLCCTTTGNEWNGMCVCKCCFWQANVIWREKGFFGLMRVLCGNGWIGDRDQSYISVACGGQTALGSCDMSGRCSAMSQICTSANYCCECPYGQAYGTCGNVSIHSKPRQFMNSQGVCPNGFSCQANGNCCPICPNNQTPFGSCVAGQCGGGRTCRSGNICC